MLSAAVLELDAQELVAWFLRALVESSGLVLLALLAERTLLRRRAAALRQGFWLLVFARLLVPPLAPIARPGAGLSGALAAPGEAAAGLLAPEGAAGGTLAGALLLAWAAVACCLVARLFLRARAARRELLAGSRPASAELLAEARAVAREAGLRRAPRVRVHDGPLPALLLGFHRPVVVLAARLEGPARRAALWHECLHLSRRDPLLQAALELLHALWWFHPLLALAKRRAAVARELACDAAVTRAWRGGAELYRRTLLAEAARLLSAPSCDAGQTLAWLRGPAALPERLGALEDRPGALHAIGARASLALLAGAAFLAAAGSPRPPAAPSHSAWWSDAAAARAEVELWRERRPGLGCATGRLVFLRALALEQGRAPDTTP